jgi:GH24 family phage-related lysozyme (muramidase)
MEAQSELVTELLNANPPRIGWAYHPDLGMDVLVERGTGCVIQGVGVPAPRTSQIHHPREIRFNNGEHKGKFRQHVGKFEGFVQYMYQDCEGHATIGIGHRIKNVEAAKDMLFFYRGTSNPVKDKAKIEKAFNDVKEPHLKCEQHTVFKNMNKFDLNPTYIENLFTKDVNQFIHLLGHHFPKFETYPALVQLGMLDIAYTMGAADFHEVFDDFEAALDYRNWKKVAAESRRTELDKQGNTDENMKARNDIVQGWFLKAIEEDPFFVDPECGTGSISTVNWYVG